LEPLLDASMKTMKNHILAYLITPKQLWSSVHIYSFHRHLEATLRPYGEKADRFVEGIKPRTTKALSAKSRGLTRRFLVVGEAFPSRSSASGSKRFVST